MAIKIVEIRTPDELKKTHAEINSLIKTLSEEDQHMLGLKKNEHDYLHPAQYKYITKRWVLKDGDKIVGFFDLLADGKPMYGNVITCVAPWMRGKGWGNKLCETGSKWIDQHIKRFNNVILSCLSENKQSHALAKKYGWKRYKDRDEDRPGVGHFDAYIKTPATVIVKEIFDSIELK